MTRSLVLLAVLGLAVAGGTAAIVLKLLTPAAEVVAQPEPPEVQAIAAPATPEPPTPPKTAEPRPGVLAIPRDGGLSPWPVTAAPPEAPNQFTSLTTIVRGSDGKHRVKPTSAALQLSAGRAVVTFTGFDPKNRPKDKMSWGEVCLCDLTTGRVMNQWETVKPLAPFDIHRDGKRFLLRLANGGYDNDARIVELWEVGADNKVKRRTWRPYYDGPRSTSILSIDDSSNAHIPAAQVKWAGFVGSQHVATLHGTMLKLWELEGLRQVNEFAGVVGLPAVSPDGGKLAFLTGDAAALLDPVSMRIVSATRIGTPPKDAVLAFHPSGSRLAAIGNGRTTVIELFTGKVWSAMMAELKTESQHDWADMPPACGWVGDKYIFFKGDLYDLDMPVPVWHYSWADWANVEGRSVWAIVDHPRDPQVLLRPFTLPHPGMANKLHTLLLTSNLFVLRPGDAVRVDVTGMPTTRQADIKQTLERRFQQQGYVIDPGAGVVVKASVDSQPKIETVDYGGTKYSYQSRTARLDILKAGKSIWNTTGCTHPPFMIWYNTRDGLADTVRNYGNPDYTIFTDKPLPGVIRAEKNHGGALGHSSFHVHGIEEH